MCLNHVIIIIIIIINVYTPQLSVLFTVNTIAILVTIRISIADLTGGQGLIIIIIIIINVFKCSGHDAEVEL